MRVVCVDNKIIAQESVPQLIIGNIYTVIDTTIVKDLVLKDFRLAEDGLYYKTVEAGAWFHSSLFIEINENLQDETEMERTYKIKNKI